VHVPQLSRIFSQKDLSDVVEHPEVDHACMEHLYDGDDLGDLFLGVLHEVLEEVAVLAAF